VAVVSGASRAARLRSGKGQILVRNVEGVPAQPAGFFDPLFQFSDAPKNAPVGSHGDNVLLSNGQSVTFPTRTPLDLSRLVLTLEGFANDDASFVLQLASAELGNTTTTTDVQRAVVNPPPACPAGYFLAAPQACCPRGSTYDGHGNCLQPTQTRVSPQPSAASPEPHHRKCDGPADCPGFANNCFAGNCTAQDTGQCNGPSDCPGFANNCFAGHCTSSDTNQCNGPSDCHGFANQCFAGHCTNP